MKAKLLFALCCILSISCVREVLPAENADQNGSAATLVKTKSTTADGYEHKISPYSLPVMQYVYDTYSAKSVKLDPTHVYVRIQPKDSAQLRYLLYDSGMELFDYPMDIELGEDEEYYDPTLEEGDLPWLYTTIDVAETIPSEFKYEVLDLCYIPEEGESIAFTKSSSIDVEEAAYLELGYEIDNGQSGGGTSPKPSGTGKMTPSGRITIYDESSYRVVPVKGVKVRGHRFVKISSAHTDANGYYNLKKSFKNHVHYSIVFDNVKGFGLWQSTGIIKAHCVLGKHDNSGYSKEIRKENDPQLWRWGAINNAGYDYYCMCEETGITAPPENMKLLVFPKQESSSTPMLRRVKFGRSVWLSFFYYLGYTLDASMIPRILDLCRPDITIGAGGGKEYADLYNHASHELAHSSHFSQVGAKYWGHYIDYIVTNGAYGSGKGPNAGYCCVGEMWGYMMGNVCQYERYGKEIPKKYSGKGGNYWFKPQVFWTLYRSHILSKKQIFDCLTEDVVSLDNLADKMFSKYPQVAYDIDTTFAANGISLNTKRYLSLRNQTIDSSMVIDGVTVTAEDVHVTNGATLTLAGGTVTLKSPFSVDYESSLVIDNQHK